MITGLMPYMTVTKLVKFKRSIL